MNNVTYVYELKEFVDRKMLIFNPVFAESYLGISRSKGFPTARKSVALTPSKSPNKSSLEQGFQKEKNEQKCNLC